MKILKHSKSPYLIIVLGMVVTLICMVICCLWVKHYNSELREISLADAETGMPPW